MALREKWVIDDGLIKTVAKIFSKKRVSVFFLNTLYRVSCKKVYPAIKVIFDIFFNQKSSKI